MKEQGPEHLLDDTGWKIIGELQQNARLPFPELARIVGLPIPAVTERVHKMEEESWRPLGQGARAAVLPAAHLTNWNSITIFSFSVFANPENNQKFPMYFSR